MEVSEVRKRLLQTIDRAKRAAAERRTQADAASAAYERFLETVATPLFRMVAASLRAEGYLFAVHTPAGGLRLASDRSAEDFIELALDTSADPPTVVARVSRGPRPQGGVDRTADPRRHGRRTPDRGGCARVPSRGNPAVRGSLGRVQASRSTNEVSRPSRRSTDRNACRSYAFR